MPPPRRKLSQTENVGHERLLLPSPLLGVEEMHIGCDQRRQFGIGTYFGDFRDHIEEGEVHLRIVVHAFHTRHAPSVDRISMRPKPGELLQGRVEFLRKHGPKALRIRLEIKYPLQALARRFGLGCL